MTGQDLGQLQVLDTLYNALIYSTFREKCEKEITVGFKLMMTDFKMQHL